MTASIDITPGQKKALLALLRRFIPGVEVWAYGSRVKWTARTNSDLDLVAFATPAQRQRVSELKEALAESNLPFLVDLHVWDEVPKRFHEIIRKEYVALQKADTPDEEPRKDTDEPSSTLGDYVTLQRGTTYKGSLVGKPGPALLGLGSIQPGGGFREGDYKTYGGECPPKLMLSPGDLFASLKGATKDGKMIGSVARVPPTVSSGRLTQDTVKLEFHDSDQETTNFIYWVLRTPQYREYCAGRATGSAVVALSRDDFLSYPVPTFTPTRMRVVEVLGSMDAMIEVNRRMIATLETIARALFKSWFVDFDPVRAKLDERKPVGMDGAIAALFPNHFDETPLGHTPKGWEVRSLDNVAQYLNGLALQKYPPGEGTTLPVIKIAQLRRGDSSDADRCSTNVPAEYIVQDGDVLFSWSGSLEVELWCGGPGALNQHLFKVTSPEFPKWFYYLWTLYHLDEFRLIAADKATTMGHIQRGHLTAAKVLVPPPDLLKVMTRIMAPLIDRIIGNRTQSRTFTTLRDTLLPKLLSGEIKVNDQLQGPSALAPL